MTDALSAARTQVREAVRELKAMEFRLLGVRTILPPLAEEVGLHDLEDMDPVTELRTAIDGFREAIRPAIEDLERVVNEPDEEGLSEGRVESPPRPPKAGPKHG